MTLRLDILLTLKTQSVSYVLRPSHFCELNSTFTSNSHYKSFAIFLPNRRIFLSNDNVTYSLQMSEGIDDEKKSNVIRVN